MSSTEVITFGQVVFLLVVVGALAGMWFRVEGAIAKAKGESILRAEAAAGLAAGTMRELQEHKLHVAETYITKAGLRETTEQIMTGVNDIKASVERLNERMDRVVENRVVPK